MRARRSGSSEDGLLNHISYVLYVLRLWPRRLPAEQNAQGPGYGAVTRAVCSKWWRRLIAEEAQFDMNAAREAPYLEPRYLARMMMSRCVKLKGALDMSCTVSVKISETRRCLAALPLFLRDTAVQSSEPPLEDVAHKD